MAVKLDLYESWPRYCPVTDGLKYLRQVTNDERELEVALDLDEYRF